jgi:hypothetical protein
MAFLIPIYGIDDFESSKDSIRIFVSLSRKPSLAIYKRALKVAYGKNG